MNLIVTCPRHMEEDAAGEIGRVLNVMGDDAPDITITGMSGILTVQTGLDPVSVSRGMVGMLKDEPWSIRYCMRVIPIHATVKAEIDAIADEAIRMAADRIQGDAAYRITVERRNTALASSDIISSIASAIPNKVSLEQPDRIILVEILGGVAGISVLGSSDIFSAEMTRRSMSEE